MNKEVDQKELQAAIRSQQTEAPTDRRDSQLEKSQGNEVSRTGRDIAARATVGLDSESAEDGEYQEQNSSGGSPR